MDKWIHNVVANNVGKGKIAENEAEIYEYGYVLLIEKIIIFVVSVVIALLLDAIWEVLALCIAFIPLRVYSGGYHAKSRCTCIVMSGMFVVLGSTGIKLLYQQINVLTYLVIEIACICVISRFAPAATDQKPVTASEARSYKKKAIVIAGAELLFGLLCFHFGVSTMITSIVLSNICNVLSVLGQVYCNNFQGKISMRNFYNSQVVHIGYTKMEEERNEIFKRNL